MLTKKIAVFLEILAEERRRKRARSDLKKRLIAVSKRINRELTPEQRVRLGQPALSDQAVFSVDYVRMQCTAFAKLLLGCGRFAKEAGSRTNLGLMGSALMLILALGVSLSMFSARDAVVMEVRHAVDKKEVTVANANRGWSSHAESIQSRPGAVVTPAKVGPLEASAASQASAVSIENPAVMPTTIDDTVLLATKQINAMQRASAWVIEPSDAASSSHIVRASSSTNAGPSSTQAMEKQTLKAVRKQSSDTMPSVQVSPTRNVAHPKAQEPVSLLKNSPEHQDLMKVSDFASERELDARLAAHVKPKTIVAMHSPAHTGAVLPTTLKESDDSAHSRRINTRSAYQASHDVTGRNLAPTTWDGAVGASDSDCAQSVRVGAHNLFGPQTDDHSRVKTCVQQRTLPQSTRRLTTAGSNGVLLGSIEAVESEAEGQKTEHRGPRLSNVKLTETLSTAIPTTLKLSSVKQPGTVDFHNKAGVENRPAVGIIFSFK